MHSLDNVVRFVVSTLLASLWLAPLFAFAAWLVLRLTTNANATTRHSVFAAALVASVAMPVAIAAFAVPTATNVRADDDDAAVPRGARSYVPVRSGPAPGVTRVRGDVRVPSFAVSRHAVPRAFVRANFPLPRVLAGAIVAGWSAVSAFLLLQLLASLVHLARLKREARPLAVADRNARSGWIAANSGSRNVRLCTSSDIDIPIAVGFVHPMILLPGHFVDGLPARDVDAIVLHELAHLRRFDDVMNAFERVASALLFFNPAIAWLAGRLDLEREVACDDWVLQHDDALPYATCLARVAERVVRSHRAAPAPALFATRHGMSIRIERLLATQRDVRVRTSFGLATSAVAAFGIIGLVAALVSPSIADDAAPAEPLVAAPLVVPAVTAPRPTVTIPALPPVPTLPKIPIPPKTVVARPIPTARIIRIAHAAPPVPAAPPPIPPVPRIPPVRPVPPDVGVRASDEDVVADSNDSTDSTYADALARAGYPGLSANQSARLRALGVTPEFIRAIERAGLGHLSADELGRLRATGVDPAFVAAMRARFGSDLNANDMASLRAVGVSSAYLDELSAAGLKNLSAGEMRRLRALDVDPGDVRRLVREGDVGLTADDVARLRATGVDAAYVAAMRARFGSSLSTDDIAGLRALGVTQSYVDALEASGVRDLTPERVRGLRALGVSPDFVKGLAAAGYPSLSAGELQQLRALGVDGDFIRRIEADGFHHPTVEKLLELKATGTP